jgi:predicted Zn-dependent protease
MTSRVTSRANDLRPPRVFTRDECAALARRVFDMVPGYQAEVVIETKAGSELSFARGDAHMAADAESAELSLTILTPEGRQSSATTSRIDDAGLKAMIAQAQAAAGEHRPGEMDRLQEPLVYPVPPKLYFDSTVAATDAESQARAFHAAVDATDAAGLIAAGDVMIEIKARARFNTRGLEVYESQTWGSFSMTARTKDNTGSGWGWSGSKDWSRVNVPEVIARAVDLGKRSANPVAVEPGRYTVILEPTAVGALLSPVIWSWSAAGADKGDTVFSNKPVGTNKIGLQMIDKRLSMISDPWDPDMPSSVVGLFDWMPIPKAVTWFERGVLKNLEYDKDYAREKGREPVINPETLRIKPEGPTQTLEEMIASTERGIWVNRLSHVTTMNRRALLLTGTTRDGTFLIENGKITKAIKNFRFTESPFFVLNRLESFGEPVRASGRVIAPRLKVQDFAFTSLTDAV